MVIFVATFAVETSLRETYGKVMIFEEVIYVSENFLLETVLAIFVMVTFLLEIF